MRSDIKIGEKMKFAKKQASTELWPMNSSYSRCFSKNTISHIEIIVDSHDFHFKIFGL